MSVAFVFPGQGSQEVGMLGEFLRSEPVVRRCFEAADHALGFSISRLVVDGPTEQLNQTEYTQPALLTASIALWNLWAERGGVAPSIMAGHSLGEYSALTAAGAIEFDVAVRLVNLRGKLMQAAVAQGDGAMAAILGLDEPAVAECCAAAGGVVTPANINAPGQIVIAGTAAAVDAAIERCSAAGAKRAIKLAVSVPSHCPLMASAAAEFAPALAQTTLVAPNVPVVQNVDAVAHGEPDRIRANLIEQLSKPVRWIDCVEAMIARGATSIVECGPGKVLGALVKRIDRNLGVFTLGERASFDSALRETAGG